MCDSDSIIYLQFVLVLKIMYPVFVSGFVCPTKPVLYLPLYVISLLSVGLYTISWQLDPCCKYKVTDKSILTKFHIEQKQLSSPSSTILLKTSIASTIWLHNIVLITATGICAYKFYKSMWEASHRLAHV